MGNRTDRMPQASPGSIGLAGSLGCELTHGYGGPERGRRIGMGPPYLIVQQAPGKEFRRIHLTVDGGWWYSSHAPTARLT